MPKPVLQAMVLADHIYRDAETGKFLIIGTFGNVIIRPPVELPPQPTEPPQPSSDTGRSAGQRRKLLASEIASAGSPYLYLALTGIHGELLLRLRYVDLSDLNVLFEGKLSVTSVDPLVLAEFSLPLPSLPQKLGSFALEVLHDEEILGQWRVNVSLQAPPEVKEQEQ